MEKRVPRWVHPFLRALERTGKVCEAAVDAGVDRTTAFVRRRNHADFAAAWERALEAHGERVRAEREAEIASLDTLGMSGLAPPGPSPHPRPLPVEGRGRSGEELGTAGGQVKRVSGERWGKRKEALFFDELAATNNISRAAAAAGVSYNAVMRGGCAIRCSPPSGTAVRRTSRAAIDMHLLAETRKSFDPETLDLPEGAPRVTIDQAIKISQIGAAASRLGTRGEGWDDPFASAAPPSEEELEALRARVLRKIERLAERRKAEKLAAGWSFDEATGQVVPPGWIRYSSE